MRLFRRFIQISFKEKKLFMEALFFLFISKIMVFVFPFKKCVKRFVSSEQLNKNSDLITLESIRMAIHRANKLAFWKNVCLVSSFAAKSMLQRRGIASVMYLGICYKEKGKMEAHAWLKVNDIYITSGGNSYYKEIYHF